MIAAALEFVTMPFFGALSDRIGRKPVVAFGAGAAVLLPFLFFVLVNTKNGWLVLIAEVLMLSVAHVAVFAPIAAWLSEMFAPEVRYSGITIGFQLLSGAPAPLIAAALLAGYHSAWPIAMMSSASAAVTLTCAVIAKDKVRATRLDFRG